MFFRTKCPIGVEEKTWVEFRMQWLSDTLGIARMQSAPIVLPNDTFFPIEFEPTPECALVYKNIVSELMSLAPDACQLEVCEPEQLPSSAAHYEPGESPTIRISSREIEDPLSLVSTLAQQLSHHILLGGNHLTTEDSDHEYVADLLTVFLGFGVFSANSTIRETNWSEGGSQRDGRWANAVICHRRQSATHWHCGFQPEVIRILVGPTCFVPMPARAMRGGIKFISKTGDTVVSPGRAVESKVERRRVDSPIEISLAQLSFWPGFGISEKASRSCLRTQLIRCSTAYVIVKFLFAGKLPN